jgi:lipopolysaccharide transport system permease protein
MTRAEAAADERLRAQDRGGHADSSPNIRPDAGPGARPTVLIAGTMSRRELVRLVLTRVRAQFANQYAGTALGLIWHVLQPLAMIIIYSLVFGVMVRVRPDIDGVPYFLFLCTALIPWISFQEGIIRGAGCYLRNRVFLRKMSVPEEVFAAESGITAGLGLAVSFTIVIAVAVIMGTMPSLEWLLLPVVLLLLMICAGGFGWAAGVICPFFTDLTQIIQIVLRPMFWMTPIIYPLSQVSNGPLRLVVLAQPVTPYAVACRDLLLDHRVPSLPVWAAMVAWPAVALLVGTIAMRSLRHEIRDVL